MASYLLGTKALSQPMLVDYELDPCKKSVSEYWIKIEQS